MKLRIHNIITETTVNGPGKRFGIWLQGCNFNCKGCFNPTTHPLTGGTLISHQELFRKIVSTEGIEGISISGGEPLLQIVPLLSFLKMIKEKTNLSVILFSGYTFNEIKSDKEKNKILSYLDILISGRYQETLKINTPYLSSSNQELHFFSDIYCKNDFQVYDTELIIDKEGNIITSGFNHLF